ncbi:Fibropellin-1 [Holothuria leucospilota]|uniref:Fibropellin-1 n=1 Tax=Holothuria leucospilota TaxID=206669 RepID=A0A9Q1HD98_HOLLE|nr:Fibropellin-1 [Holothuria leucospilota]
MSFVKFAACLIIGWACEDDIPTTTTGVTEAYGTDLPGPGQGCDLRGLWYNELGSEAYLKVAPDGFMKGEYRTAVEFSYGAAGDGPSYVVGTSTPDGKIFGFSVLWDGYNSTSATSWVGVCEICDGQEILKTSWVLQGWNGNQCRETNKRYDITVFLFWKARTRLLEESRNRVPGELITSTTLETSRDGTALGKEVGTSNHLVANRLNSPIKKQFYMQR